MFRTRFAPSPTGLLHVGNAYSALECMQWAKSHGAELLLRIEDIDFTRCRPEFTLAIFEDLKWLGIEWSRDVRKQSEHGATYQQALERLIEAGVLYPCFCTRKQIHDEITRMGLAPHSEEMGDPYPGSCKHLSAAESRQRLLHEPHAWRLDMEAALQQTGSLQWTDSEGAHHPVSAGMGDVVIGRKDVGISYHLAVVIDDALQEITHVIRGQDLETSTDIHRILQALLELPSPIYSHHPLILTPDGERLAKRNGAPSLHALRKLGIDPAKLSHYLLHEAGGIWAFPEADGRLPEKQLGFLF